MLASMGALTDFWNSERGLLVILLVIACTVLCGLGQVTSSQWLSYTRWVFTAYAASKTVTGALAISKGAQQPPTPPT